MKSNESDSRCDWEMIQLPALFIRMSSDGETVTRKTLREAIAYQEFIHVYAADMVIQSAIDDGIIDQEDGTVLRLNEGVNIQFGDFYHVE